MSTLQLTGGWIEVIAGVMFSGKSEELMRRVRRAMIARKRVQSWVGLRLLQLMVRLSPLSLLVVKSKQAHRKLRCMALQLFMLFVCC